MIRRRGLRILFDPMHGSGTYPLTVVLTPRAARSTRFITTRTPTSAGNFPRRESGSCACLPTRCARAATIWGLAFDGDGDRLGVIDRNGAYVDANRILVMLYYYLHEYRGWRGPVVRNNATTHMLDRVAGVLRRGLLRSSVGFKYISAKIDETPTRCWAGNPRAV